MLLPCSWATSMRVASPSSLSSTFTRADSPSRSRTTRDARSTVGSVFSTCSAPTAPSTTRRLRGRWASTLYLAPRLTEATSARDFSHSGSGTTLAW